MADPSPIAAGTPLAPGALRADRPVHPCAQRRRWHMDLTLPTMDRLMHPAFTGGMTTLTRTLTIGTAVGSGLVGGVLFGFSTFVMRALDRLPAAQGLAAMQ